MPFLPTGDAEAGPAGVDLTLGPPGDTDHYCSSRPVSRSGPVIPARTKIASAPDPHILCPLAVTYALAAVSPLSPQPPAPAPRRCFIGRLLVER